MRTHRQAPLQRARTSMTLALSVALWLLAAWGCQGDPDVRETITDLRVLGVQASPPEAKPGDKVKLDVLAVLVPSATIAYKWYLCKSPDGAADGCHLQTDANAFSEDQSPEITVPSEYLEGISDPAVALRGRYLFVTLVATSGDQEVVATKRIVVSSSPTNTNPSLRPLQVFQADGKAEQTAPFSASTKQEIKLRPALADGASQSYEIIDPNGQKRTAQEQLYYSWYTTAGTYSQGYLTRADAPENTWKVPEETPKDPNVTLYLVVRDGRGGITWQATQIAIK